MNEKNTKTDAAAAAKTHLRKMMEAWLERLGLDALVGIREAGEPCGLTLETGADERGETATAEVAFGQGRDGSRSLRIAMPCGLALESGSEASLSLAVALGKLALEFERIEADLRAL